VSVHCDPVTDRLTGHPHHCICVKPGRFKHLSWSLSLPGRHKTNSAVGIRGI